MTTERPILGLRPGETVSQVRDRKDLKFLLTQADQLPRTYTDIDGIRRDLVCAAQAEIPVEFLFSTGLADLAWQQIYHPNALSSIYLGVGSRGINPIFFQQAAAIIAIHSQIEEDQIRVVRVSLSTIIEDSAKRKRALALTYDAVSKEATLAYLSIGDDERPSPVGHYHPDTLGDIDRSLFHIPTDITQPPIFPGMALISQRMVFLTAGGHNRMIMASARLGNQTSMGFNHWSLQDSGFFEHIEGNNRAIGRRTNFDETSWTVQYPAHLEFSPSNSPG